MEIRAKCGLPVLFIHAKIDLVVSIQARICMTDAELSDIWPYRERFCL